MTVEVPLPNQPFSDLMQELVAQSMLALLGHSGQSSRSPPVQM